ncbi:outer membrane biogenesis protein BamB [Symmachiella dynata]|uniref:Outer membrane biogenesis protein BamB n=1 Tax=Symmachiella dynata TaxID=2527995 RepID=A0A517ZU49_9PLAN|nr:PQQ-binding-like beta-propeller repeat protein [Symmachiella dynata]QDU45980.1 outer membrane biogenesis protein BamB [Symmachiella dynata]
MRFTCIVRCLAVVALATAVVTVPGSLPAEETFEVDPLDWPHWRGPEYNGISRETGLVDSWSPDGENVLWFKEYLGSRSTPIIMRGKLYTITRDDVASPREGEKVVCADAVTGEKIWENKFNVYLSDVPAERVGWSSVVGDPTTGRVYALGVCGLFQCIDGETGETIWSHSLSEEYGALTTYGGRTNVPVIHGNLVIISAIMIDWGDMAKPAHRFIAFDKRNGQPVWFNGTRLLPYDTNYSSPVLATIDGQEVLVFGSGDGGVHAFQPQTGKPIWSYDVSRRGINVTPLVVGDRVFAGHSEENLVGTKMGAVFAIDGTGEGDVTKSKELWRNERMMVGKSSPIMVDGKLVTVDDRGGVIVLDPETGKTIAKKKIGRMMRSSPVYADGKIYVCSTGGRWHILKLEDDRIKIVHKLMLKDRSSHGSPVISHGRIYIPFIEGMYCIGKKDQQPTADPRPAPAEVTPVSADDVATQVQVVPVEALLKPGQKLQYQARLYNARGQFLKVADDAKFSIEGIGTISGDGKYEASNDPAHSEVKVTANVGDLSGTARIRIVPPLPWKFEFDDGQVPVTWVGARYRHIALDFDLLKKLEQQSPLASQLYIYLMTSYINSGRPVAKFADDSPRMTWSALLRFLERLDGSDSIRTLDEAKAALDPALQLLADEKVVAEWDWATPTPDVIQLTVKQGTRPVDGNGVMTKIKTIPKGARSQSWMGHVGLHDYTIQADVLGASKNGKMPDIGLIGQRYTLDLMGNSQQLQIRTWPPQLRMAQTIPFTWEPEVWYTMKLQSAIEDGKAVLRGKVWKRDEAEPEQWLVEAVDMVPNLTGSPGLFGNAKEAELFIDNVQVIGNK